MFGVGGVKILYASQGKNVEASTHNRSFYNIFIKKLMKITSLLDNTGQLITY